MKESKDILKESGVVLANSFLLAYGSRSALSLLLKLGKIISSPWVPLSLSPSVRDLR